MATPVVTVASGGLPVVDNTAAAFKSGLPVSEAANGRGIPVTKVANGGLPVMYVVPSSTGGFPSLADEKDQTGRDRARSLPRRQAAK
jgi:hypothetical protein